MPQRRNAIKALRITRRKTLANLDIKTDLRKTLKKFRTLIQQKNKNEAQSILNTVYKKLDKAAKRNILHKNTAARRKSTFSRLVKSIA